MDFPHERMASKHHVSDRKGRKIVSQRNRHMERGYVVPGVKRPTQSVSQSVTELTPPFIPTTSL